MMQRAKRFLGLAAALLLTSTMLASGFLWASQQRSALALFAAFMAWTGYLFAHYLATGSFMDGKDASVATGWSERGGVVLGGAILIAGMLVGIRGVRAADIVLTNVGGVLFLGGYIVAHRIATGEIL